MNFELLLSKSLHLTERRRNVAEMDTKASAFSVFPAEIWEEIFQNFTSAGQLEATAKSFPEFSYVIRRVFKKPYFQFKQVLPNLVHYLSPKDLQNCRLVSKLWCENINNLFEESYSLSVRNQIYPIDEKILKLYYMVPPRGAPFDIVPTTDQFTRYNNHPHSPIVGRSLHVFMGCPYDEAKMPPFRTWSNVWTNMRHVRFSCHADTLYQVLKLSPFLRSIHFQSYQEHFEIDEAPFQLPDLPNLHSIIIDIKIRAGTRLGVLDFVLKKYSPQLKHLSLRTPRREFRPDAVDQKELNEFLASSEFPNLEELSVTGQLDVAGVLKNLKKSNLRKLSWLQISFSLEPQLLQSLMEFTQNVPTLSHIKILQVKQFEFRVLPPRPFGWPKYKVADLLQNDVVSKNVKTLELEIQTRYIDLSFVLLFPHIQKLLIKLREFGTELTEIDEYGNNLLSYYCKNLGERSGNDPGPSIWQVLPNLYYVEVVECKKRENSMAISFSKGFKRHVSAYKYINPVSPDLYEQD